MNKAGRELDALIAEKVMGWKLETIVTSTYGSKADVWKNEDEKIMAYCREWKPSSDISAAWQVFEWLEKRGIVRVSNGDGDSKDCDFLPNGFQGVASAHISADSFPLAICLAVLGAVGVQPALFAEAA